MSGLCIVKPKLEKAGIPILSVYMRTPHVLYNTYLQNTAPSDIWLLQLLVLPPVKKNNKQTNS